MDHVLKQRIKCPGLACVSSGCSRKHRSLACGHLGAKGQDVSVICDALETGDLFASAVCEATGVPAAEENKSFV